MKDRNEKVDDALRGDARGDVEETRRETRRATDRRSGASDDPDGAAEIIGETTGGIAGAATGAAIGSLGGPIGTIIGGIAGALGGWWAGHAIADAAATFTDEDDRYYRDLFESRRSGGALRSDAAAADEATNPSDTDYDAYRPAYQLGQIASRNPDYDRRSFDEVEGDLRRGWTDDVRRRYGEWDDVRDYARAGFDRGREARLRESEEQLAASAPPDAPIDEEIPITIVREEVVIEVPLVDADVPRERVDDRSARGAQEQEQEQQPPPNP